MSDDETIINSDVRDTPKQNEEPQDSSIPLFLGDIIKITAPTNEIFNEQTFLIDYIDKNKGLYFGYIAISTLSYVIKIIVSEKSI